MTFPIGGALASPPPLDSTMPKTALPGMIAAENRRVFLSAGKYFASPRLADEGQPRAWSSSLARRKPPRSTWSFATGTSLSIVASSSVTCAGFGAQASPPSALA